MDCRSNCGACCIAISISSPIPGMPDGKPAGVRCLHLNDAMRCDLFGKSERPDIWSSIVLASCCLPGFVVLICIREKRKRKNSLKLSVHRWELYS